MSYSAIILPITAVHPVEGSTAGLKIYTVAGSQIISSSTYNIGDLVCYFAEGGALAPEFLFEINGYREGHGKNKDSETFGFFESNGRVRTIRLLGVNSEGFICSLETLSAFTDDLSPFVHGYSFDTINGLKICEKYITQATKRYEARVASGQKKIKNILFPDFAEHYETGNLKTLPGIQPGSWCVITEKLHGTSGRTGRLLTEVKNPTNFSWLKNKFLGLVSKYLYPLQPVKEYQYVTGSRRVVMTFDNTADPNKINCRHAVHNSFVGKLLPGETVYYEIVGYEGDSALFKQPIPKDNIGKSIAKKYKTDTMYYSYGCQLKEYKVFIYRITMTIEGNVIELPWNQVKARAELMGMQVAPTLSEFIYQEGNFLDIARETSAGSSILDPRHIKEGVCLRIHSPSRDKAYKYKSFEFCHLEGIAKDDKAYIDLEESS